MIFHITCNTDNNYLQHCIAMLCSLFENNQKETFFVHILTSNLPESSRRKLENISNLYNNECKIYDVDETKLKGVKFRKENPLSMAAYYRILLPEILENSIDKILYLDCDLVVLSNIKELFEINLDGYALAACSDASPYNSLHRFQLGLSIKDEAFCSGVMMINLRYWRETGAEAKLLTYSKKDRKVVFLHDQDALNNVFRNQWFKLSGKWGKTPMSICPMDGYSRSFDQEEYAFAPMILHYASPLKPWMNVWFPQKKYYLKYLKTSGFEHPSFKKVSIKYKITVLLKIIKYYLSRYVLPVFPDILIILCRDVLFILELIIYAIMRPSKVKVLILHRWVNKHNK